MAKIAKYLILQIRNLYYVAPKLNYLSKTENSGLTRLNFFSFY